MNEVINKTAEVERKKKRTKLWCAKCYKGLGHATKEQLQKIAKWYGNEKKVLKYYLCRCCRRTTHYGKYLKEIREKKEE